MHVVSLDFIQNNTYVIESQMLLGQRFSENMLGGERNRAMLV